MLEKLLFLPRYQKRFLTVAIDALFIPVSLWLALSLHSETLYWTSDSATLAVAITTVVSSIFVFMRVGLYRAVIRYMSNHAINAVLIGVSFSALVLYLSGLAFDASIPVTVPIIYWCLGMIFVGGSRMLVRSLVHRRVMKGKERVIIYGAGKTGLQVSSMLFHSKELLPIAFIDDDPGKVRCIFNGLRVYPSSAIADVIDKYGAQRILLALGKASRPVRRSVIHSLEDYPLQVQTVPYINDLVQKKSQLQEIQDVEIEDLLGRDEVRLDRTLLSDCITRKVVMVTGAGGSIGSELSRQIVKLKPKCLVMYDISESALVSVQREVAEYADKKGLNIRIEAVLGSVQDKDRTELVMRSFDVETLYHAAAYKHVHLVEKNIIEGVKNNAFGTWYCAEAAINAHVETFVLISTDKAVRPSNVMGASKRLAELVLQGLAQRQSMTRFCMVRFGNVLGSSGSVVPLFRKQIKAGGPVTVTHKDVTRYFMTMTEAAQLVLQAGSMGEGGEVFLLDMGDSVKISDLAEKLIKLMGLEVKRPENPLGDITIKYTGLRPGEKLHEELLIGNNAQETSHPRILKALEFCLEWEEISSLLYKVDIACNNFDVRAVHQELMRAPLGYSPSSDMSDLVWQKNQSKKRLYASVSQPPLEKLSGPSNVLSMSDSETKRA